MLTKKQRWFLAVLLLALAVRVAFVWLRPSTLDYPDERSYNTVAENFLDGRGFVLSERLRVHRTPGYPIMLAAVYSIAGRGNLPAVGLVQAALGTLTVALTAALAIALFGPQAALAAAAVAALYPFHLYMTPLLLTETLFTLLLLLYTAAVVKLTAPQSADCLGWALVAGLAGGAAIMTKPSILPLIPATAVLVALIARPRKTAITASVLLLVLSTAVVLPWTVRNHRLTGHLVLTTLWTGKSLYEAVGPQADGGPAMDRITLDEPPNAIGPDLSFRQRSIKRRQPSQATAMIPKKLQRMQISAGPEKPGFLARTKASSVTA